MEDLHDYLFSLTERNMKRIFALTKSEKQKQLSAFVLQWALQRQRARPTDLLPWEPHSASQPQAPIALNCVWEHLCFISVNFGHPSVRCVLSYQKSLRQVILGVWECSNITPYKLKVIPSSLYAMWAWKGFLGYWKYLYSMYFLFSLFSDSGRNL